MMTTRHNHDDAHKHLTIMITVITIIECFQNVSTVSSQTLDNIDLLPCEDPMWTFQ